MKVKVYIESTDMDGEVSESVFNAVMEERQNDYKLSYVEDISGEGKTTRTTMYVSGSSLRIIRSGELVSDFIYSSGLEHNTTYQTPYGDIPVTIITDEYNFVGNSMSYGDDIFSGGINPLKTGRSFTINADVKYAMQVQGAESMELGVKIKIEAQ